MEGNDSSIKIGANNFTEIEVDLMKNTFNEYMDGYETFIKKVSKPKNIVWSEISDVDDFIALFYKGGLFE